MAPAAPSAWPIIDLVEVIHGIAPGRRSRAAAQAATSRGSAPVAVRWPLTASTSSGPTSASASACRMQRRTPSGLGAVMLPPLRWPPQFTPAPSTSAWMRAPRARALSRLSSTSTPAPEPGTKPPAEALMGREARSGSSLKLRQSTRMASKPAQMAAWAPSTPPQSMRSARPERIRHRPSATASAPVAQALEFAVTWLPSASSPETRAETPLAITCSTAVLPRRRIFLAETIGTTRSAMVSMPPIPVPITAPLCQSTRSSPRSGRASPASCQASTAASEP